MHLAPGRRRAGVLRQPRQLPLPAHKLPAVAVAVAQRRQRQRVAVVVIKMMLHAVAAFVDPAALPFLLLPPQPPAVRQAHRRVLAPRLRRQVAKGGHALWADQQHQPARIARQGDIRRRGPAVAAVAGFVDIRRRVAAHPGERQPPRQQEILLRQRHAAVADIHRLGPQHLALEEPGIHVFKQLLAKFLKLLHKLAVAGAFFKLFQSLAKAEQAGAHQHRRHVNGRRPTDGHLTGNGQVDSQRHRQRQRLGLGGALRAERRHHAEHVAAQHRHGDAGERFAVHPHRAAAHKQLVIPQLRAARRAQRRQPHAADRDMHRHAAGAGAGAFSAIHPYRGADKRNVVKDVEHQADMGRRQRSERIGMDIDPQLRIKV
ncbi:Uncharacterised protein [Serratia rubidaea]|nr:Uncharacterised protein [Serratia rubidaea]